MSRRLCLILSALLPAACATTGAVPHVDLESARKAVEAAREAGAPERAAEPFGRAQSHLAEAESLAKPATGDTADRTRKAQALAQVATAEAVCAADMARAATQAQASQASASSGDDKLAARLRRSEEEQRRLEERLSLIQRELELSETEVARTKARLKGSETKAEASSTIAEARILLGRMLDDRNRAAVLARANELMVKAERALKEDNYGAASYFALRAQEVATRTPEQQAAAAANTDAGRPAPHKSYQVSVTLANIRGGPSTSDPIVGSAPKGATLEASAMRGEWIKVSYGGVTGWVHRSLVQ